VPLKILPYALGTLIGVYLNYIPINPKVSTLVGVVIGLIMSSLIGISLLVTLGIGRAIVGYKKTNSRIRLGKKIKGLSKFTASLMGGSFFSCSFFIFLQTVPLYLSSAFKEYNPIETPVDNWNSFHYDNSFIFGAFVSVIVAIIVPILSWVISKWVNSVSDRIKFSDKEERTLEIFQGFLLNAKKFLWLTYSFFLMGNIPVLAYRDCKMFCVRG
jgi:hypothetical protein